MAIHRRQGIRGRPPLGGAAGLLALLASAPVAAQASLDTEFPEGFAINVFEPAPAGDRFFAVADAPSATDGKVRLSFTGDYPTQAVLRRTDNQTGVRGDVIGSQLYLHGGISYPVTDWLHAHASVPFAAVQNGDTRSTPEGGRFGDVRLGARANVLDPDQEAVAFGPGVDVWLPTGSESELTGDGNFRVNPKVGASGRAGAFLYTANVGYLARKKVDSGSLEYGDAVTFGAALGLRLFDEVLQIGPEIWGNSQVSPDHDYTEVTPLSALFGAKVRVGDIAFGIGAGPGLSEAPGVAPRVVASVALAPETHVDVSGSVETGPPRAEPAPAPVVDGDGDGIADTEDACKDQLGDRSTDPAKNGCPAPRIADGDGDGVRDEIDVCPDKPGVGSTDPKTNGCPAELGEARGDSDGDGVVDREDACVHEVGERTADPSTTGCPKATPLAKPVQKAGGSGESAVRFSGFQVFDDGSSRLYVQMTSEAQIEPVLAGKKAEYLLRNARIPARNNKNALVTRHFASVVTNVRLMTDGDGKGKRRGKKQPTDVRLVVDMREAVKPVHRVNRNADGTATLVVDFPKPSAPPPPEPDPTPPPVKALPEPKE